MTETNSAQTTSQEDNGDDGFYLHALIGAVAMVVLSFIPLSPLLGGAAAGYLHRRNGMKLGAIAGLFAAPPVVAMMLVLTYFAPVVTALQSGTDIGFGLLGPVLLLLVVGLYTVILGALGGYLGVYLNESRTTTSSA